MFFIKEQRIYNSRYLFAELYVKELPSKLPSKSDDVSGLPKGYNFVVGSIMYVVSTSELYMADGTGSWIKQ